MYMQIIKITILGLYVLEGLEEKIIVNTENEIIVIIKVLLLLLLSSNSPVSVNNIFLLNYGLSEYFWQQAVTFLLQVLYHVQLKTFGEWFGITSAPLL